MRVISDLHIHSRFAMACSSQITIQGIHDTAVQKGINLIGTGDFTHPDWLAELKAHLEPAEPGMFRINGSQSDVRFIMSGEVSTNYNVNGLQKRIHNIILMPDIEAVESLNQVLAKRSDLRSDGRLQVQMTPAQLVEEARAASPDAFIFPAHIWTPYFGVLGVKAGFSSVKEAYDDQDRHIHAVEMGLSSNPLMNWRVSSLDRYALLGNSDMHSLPKMGRDMNVFEMDEKSLSFSAITSAIKKKDKNVFKYVVKFYPEEGKYHFDGHRGCMVSIDPEKSSVTKCPVCGKNLTVGVVHRVNDLADRPSGYKPNDAIPYISAVPLREVVAYVLRKNDASIAVSKMYIEMTAALGTEYDVLVDVDTAKISEKFGADMGQAISNMRKGDITIAPGYDGVFGKIDLLNRNNGKKDLQGWKQKIL